MSYQQSVCFQLKRRVGWELGLWNFRQQWRTAKKQLTNNTEHMTQNKPSGPRPSGVWENIFHLFRSSASGKYNLNLRSFGFSSADPSREENSDIFRAKLSLDLLTFLFKTITEYFLQLPLFICTYHRCILLTGEEICWSCLNFTALPCLI